jgi:hypothetical protein
MTVPVFYVLDGHTPVAVDDMDAWARMMEGERHVAFDEVAPGVEVSTVFLGVDHNFSGRGPPLLFETMVFSEDDGGETHRYSTWQEAEDGHKAVADRLRRNLVETVGWLRKHLKYDC